MKIRAAQYKDAAEIAKVHVESWITTYRGFVSEEFLQSLTCQEREKKWKNGLSRPEKDRCTYVVENDDGDVVGFAGGGRERSGKFRLFDGELYAIYILEEAQKKGAGTKLFQNVMKKLMNKGFNSILVWVLADNLRARSFYESFNPKQVGSEKIKIGDTEHDEIAYGWDDIKKLL